jgi:hypothetical protein
MPSRPLGGPGAFMPGHLLGNLEPSPVLQVVRDPVARKL